MSQNKKLIQSILRAYSRSPRTPPWQVFFRPAALKNLVIHQVFLRFFALQGEKIPTNSVHLEILNRLLEAVPITEACRLASKFFVCRRQKNAGILYVFQVFLAKAGGKFAVKTCAAAIGTAS